MSCYSVAEEITSVCADFRTACLWPMHSRAKGNFSIERDYLLRDSAAGLSIDFMNRDVPFGDPLANDRVDHRASANRAQSLAPINRSVCLTWV